MNIENYAILISLSSLFISLAVLWLNEFRKGTIRATIPQQIVFFRDQILVSQSLFSTAKRGTIIELMYLRLTINGKATSFPVWIYDFGEKPVRGRGLFVSQNGLFADHYFVPIHNTRIEFQSGTYLVEVFAQILHRKKELRIVYQQFTLSTEQASYINEYSSNKLFFDYEPVSKLYIPHLLRSKESKEKENIFRDILAGWHRPSP